MASAINVDVAELAGLIVEAVLYGVFLILFLEAMYLTYMRRKRVKANKILVSVAAIMLILATIQLVADTANIFLAFINRSRAERIEFLHDVSQPVFILKHTTLILMLLVSDSFVTYRCWIIWDKVIWIVVLPICLCLGSAVTGFHAIWSFQHFHAETRTAQEKWLISISSLSLAANAVSTALAAFRIWHRSRKTAKVVGATTSSLMPVVKIVVESGALNAAYMLANTITLAAGTEGLETMAELGTPLVGCIFMLVIMRVCINSEQTGTSANSKTGMALHSMPRRSGEAGDERSGAGRRVVISQKVFVTRDYVQDTEGGTEGKPDASYTV
ncbi:hypothetical protein GLOTRDRAFT_128796 [Gloeophyllum trabeum ATCC 11539]|uniref:Uncharacterized protein n=1 Tax=Gloeophyllum trabeum (strain ATCC 11539 / FP-39264 / Madison 617) TaxID=670483 RepID=S7Q7Z7_GLOTA|nr:uncharacterized protein GLOTRDRAFT_128796 [Gloeophyllum trabeum ATCC 11539]EPQ55568.1 hypothetical protein GLOTRDRAFT_128796 [Gloeophyllum trabeum ATCC 11539]